MALSYGQALFVVLETRPSISIGAADATGRIELDGMRYALLETEVGFYDFLRVRETAIIGFRFCFFTRQRLLKDAAGLDYVYIDKRRRYIEIYLEGYRGSATHDPGDQALGDDAIWRCDLGTYALQFGTTGLSDAEFDSLKKHMRSPL